MAELENPTGEGTTYATAALVWPHPYRTALRVRSEPRRLGAGPATARPLDGGGQGHLHRRVATLVVELPGEDHVDEGAPAGAAVRAAAVDTLAVEEYLRE